MMFEKIVFESEKEKSEFEKYLHLKGTWVHKQIYDILIENNDTITYRELSSIIRYDKNLRDTLYIYLATYEEYLRAILTERYDVDASSKDYKNHDRERLKKDLHLSNGLASNLFRKLQVDLSVLMEICAECELITLSAKKIKEIKELRNHTMHHHMLLLGAAHNNIEVVYHLSGFEKQLEALQNALPEEYRKGFLSDLRKLVHPICMKRLYLEVQDGRICVKK